MESAGPTQGLGNHMPYLLQVQGSVLGGQLRMSWTYSEAFHHRETIERLSQDFITELRSLIAHCLSPEAGGYTPSDLPEAGLTQGELDDVLARLDLMGE
jgi:non-ribosomal peptide synthase protein (TIGR01720 family)